MRKIRHFMQLVLLFSVLMIVSACGGGYGDQPADQDSAGNQTNGSDEEPPLPPPPEIDGATITEDLEDHTIGLGIGLSETSPTYAAFEHFGEILDERTNGQLTVQIFPNNQLGGDNEMRRALQTGSLEMTWGATSAASAENTDLRVFDLPYLFPDRESAFRVMDSETGQRLLDGFSGTGIKGLAFNEVGYVQTTNDRQPVETPEDMQGLNVRVTENPVQVQIFEALGTNPTTMSFGELFSALEQGVVDGQANPWSTILTSNFYEVQQFATETQHVYIPGVTMVSQQFWDGLDPQYQEVIQEAAVQSAEYQRELSGAYDEWSKEQLRERGMEVVELDEQQQREFRETTEIIYDRWSSEIGEDLVNEIQDAVDRSE